jgi:CBS domain-containing protein
MPRAVDLRHTPATDTELRAQRRFQDPPRAFPLSLFPGKAATCGLPAASQHFPMLSARRPIMKVSEMMTRDVRTARPEQTIIDAARLMAECDCGALPVEEQDRLVGMITDRDIVVRAVAQGRADARIADVMSRDIKYCFDDEDVESVAHNMADIQMRRLPVVNRDKRLVGILSLGDIARTDQMEASASALHGISEGGARAAGGEARPH